MLDDSYYFLPKELVYYYVAKIMKGKYPAFKYAIEEKEKQDKKKLQKA